MGKDGVSAADVVNTYKEDDLINIIRSGIPKVAMASIMDIGNLTLADMAAITHTSDRTLRRYKPQEKLTQDQSERMIELAKLYTRGEEVFGAMDLFNEWMNTRLLPFNNKRPKDYLDTMVGINMIFDELGRIEHGVLA
jgi:putative toxin-antitoxin system antitoxin component (TIGR02293 family)